MDYALNVPINSVSFGNVSVSLLREAYKAGHQPCIFPIGNQIDLSTQKEDKDFVSWLQSCLNKSYSTHKRKNPAIKLWHLHNNGIESVSDKQILFTFYELDSPTQSEINVIKNNHKVIFACDYNTNIFKEYGCDNIETIPLGFDSFNFSRIDKKYFDDDRISFFIPGKWEPVRKRTEKVIKAWIKRFGNNPKYFLNCAIWNHFVPVEQQKQIYVNMLEGKQVSNVQFLGFMPNNATYNDFINSNDIVLSMGTESWGLPEFHAVGIGKYGIISNCAGHKQWANSDNSLLVNPNQKIPAYDNMFFFQNAPWNQGNIFDFDENEFINNCESVIKKVEQNRINTKGLELQDKFKYSNTFSSLMKLVEEIQ